MMIKRRILLFFIFSASICFPQVMLKTHLIGDELKKYNINTNENPASNNISDIVIQDSNIWIGTSRGISLSTDKGTNWTNFYDTETFGSESVSAIAYDKYTNSFWAATAHSIKKDNDYLPVGSGLRYTTDNGLTWTSIPQPLDAQDDTIEIYGDNHLKALPVTVAVQNLVYDIAFTPNTVWIATFAGGLRKSTDKGQTWHRVLLPPDYLSSIKPTDTLDFCLQPVAGKFCSENNLNHRVFSVIAINDSTLFVGTAGGINKSTDNGISWTKYSNTNQTYPISGNFVVALGYQDYTNTLWAATWKAEGASEFYGVSATQDSGETWQIFLEGEKVHNFGFNGNHVAAPSDNGVFRSSNQGVTWLKPTSIVDNFTNLQLLTSVFYSTAFNGKEVWLGSDQGLVKLTETDPDIRMWSGVWKVFIASRPGSGSYAFPNPFNPKTDILKIKYNLAASDKISITIYDFGMNYVRTVVQNADRNPVHMIDSEGAIDYWDGKDDSGKLVPNGVYFYRVEKSSGDPFYGKILVLQ